MGLVMKMILSLPCELAWKLVRLGGFPSPGSDGPVHFFLKIRLHGVLDHVDVSYMPGQRAADKETLSFYVPRTLGKRLRKMANQLGTTLTEVVVMILTKETNSIELSPEDYEEIARETRAAQRQNTARSKAKAAGAGKGRA